MSGSNTIIRNCIISNNASTTPHETAGQGGGIYLDYYTNSLYVVNCTIAENTASTDGGGIYFEQYENPPSITIRNSILWDNSPNQISTYGTYKGLVLCCDIQGGWPGPGPGGKPPNMDENPLFADPANEDYHLKSQAGRWDSNEGRWTIDEVTSPCIDAGNPGCSVGDEASKTPENWRSIADVTNDWVVGFNDLKIFVNYWLESGECIPSDLDRSKFVDFKDFALFGQQWSYPSALEPGIVYQVEECNMDAGQNQPSAAYLNDTRFSVRVEGSYIHFKDLITANCCADEIELQMTVEDGLITIREIEHLTTPCFCICDYPATATLGPFEPGSYILEVYEDYGGHIGSTTVVIEPSE
jgi:predicted outer membrane repeat protein